MKDPFAIKLCVCVFFQEFNGNAKKHSWVKTSSLRWASKSEFVMQLATLARLASGPCIRWKVLAPKFCHVFSFITQDF